VSLGIVVTPVVQYVFLKIVFSIRLHATVTIRIPPAMKEPTGITGDAGDSNDGLRKQFTPVRVATNTMLLAITKDIPMPINCPMLGL
jgi:hypothetical protein